MRYPAGAAGEFSSPESTFRADSYSVFVPPPCYRCGTQKTLQSFCQKSGGGLQLNTLTPLTQRGLSGLTLLFRHSLETHQGNELACNSSGHPCSQSSQLAEPLWTNPGLKSGTNAQAVSEPSNLPLKSSYARKKPALEETADPHPFTLPSLPGRPKTDQNLLQNQHVLSSLPATLQLLVSLETARVQLLFGHQRLLWESSPHEEV